MSPFLESWYSQTTCKHCGEPIMFENKIPLESDGTDHREVCARLGNSHVQSSSDPVIPEKPTHKVRALEHEVLHEGQSTLESFSKINKKLYLERWPK